MKNFRKTLLLFLFICFLSVQNCFAQNDYSYDSIIIYNQGVAFHNQQKYEQASQKYIQVIKMQPNFSEARKNLGKAYRGIAYQYYSKADYNNAILYAKKSLEINNNEFETYYIMADSYRALENYENAVITYNKLLSIRPNEESVLNSLAYAYIKTNQHEKAQEIYKKVLLINPNDKIAQQNIKYVNYQQTDKKLTQSLNNLQLAEHAPKSVYRRVRRDWGIPRSYVESIRPILDLIWSEPSGKTLLTSISKRRIPIRIVSSNGKAQTVHSIQTITTYDFGMVPVNSYTSTTVEVKIPTSYIDNFNNNSLSSRKRIDALTTFVHEFGHAFMLINDDNNKDSIEEEIGVSMIGYNLASKVLTGEYLTREQAKDYGIGCLEGALSDDHKTLPVYSNFKIRVKRYGIDLPYPEEYLDLVLMYKKLRSEGKVVPVNNFDNYIR